MSLYWGYLLRISWMAIYFLSNGQLLANVDMGLLPFDPCLLAVNLPWFLGGYRALQPTRRDSVPALRPVLLQGGNKRSGVRFRRRPSTSTTKSRHCQFSLPWGLLLLLLLFL